MIYNDPTPLINELDLDMKKEEVKIEESLYLRRENRDGLTQEQINEIELFESYGDILHKLSLIIIIINMLQR